MIKKISEVLSVIKKDFSVEVRMLHVNKKGTVSGYYNDYSCLESDIKQYDGKNDIYITLNSILPTIIARSKNHLTSYAKNTTTDKEIIRRKWILIDLDPERPAGISSTDEELEYAHKMAEEIKDYLEKEGFTEPVYAMSGNGYHLLYSTDLLNSSEVTNLVKSFLCTLDKRFSNERVKVDTSTYNPARIVKLYGTVACKGDDTEDRPHRLSLIHISCLLEHLQTH